MALGCHLPFYSSPAALLQFTEHMIIVRLGEFRLVCDGQEQVSNSVWAGAEELQEEECFGTAAV